MANFNMTSVHMHLFGKTVVIRFPNLLNAAKSDSDWADEPPVQPPEPRDMTSLLPACILSLWRTTVGDAAEPVIRMSGLSRSRTIVLELDDKILEAAAQCGVGGVCGGVGGAMGGAMSGDDELREMMDSEPPASLRVRPEDEHRIRGPPPQYADQGPMM